MYSPPSSLATCRDLCQFGLMDSKHHLLYWTFPNIGVNRYTTLTTHSITHTKHTNIIRLAYPGKILCLASDLRLQYEGGDAATHNGTT